MALRKSNWPARVVQLRFSGLASVNIPKVDDGSLHPLWKSFIKENFEDQSETVVVPKSKEAKQEEKEIIIREQMIIHRAFARCVWGGHMQAALDPLGEARPPYKEGIWLPKNQYDTAALFPYSSRTMIRMPHSISLIGGRMKWITVQRLFTKLNSIYSKSIGVEELHYMWYLQNWLGKKLELNYKPEDNQNDEFDSSQMDTPSDARDSMVTLRRVVQAHAFENWLMAQHPELSSGLGAEILSTAVQSLTDVASMFNALQFNLAMSTTRGRLNVILNALRKPPEQVLAALEDFSLKGRYLDMSDRISLGLNSSKVSSISNDPLVVSLLPNVFTYPDTHIGLLIGKTRADQLFYRDIQGEKVWPIMIHGDWAVTSHGSMYEMARLSRNPDYSVQGAIHIIISDQRMLQENKSTKVAQYCTDVMRGIDALTLHVNSDDIDAVNRCIEIAVEYRAKFKKSVIVNLVCTPEDRAKHSDYFYKSIFGNDFTRSLIKRGKTSGSVLWKSVESLKDLYSSKYNLREFNFMDWVDSPWKKGSETHKGEYIEPITGITPEMLELGVKTLKKFYTSLNIHPSIKEELDKRNALAQENMFTFITAEAIALNTLVRNRFNIRLSGEEVVYPNKRLPFRYYRLEDMTSTEYREYLDTPTKGSFVVACTPASANTSLEYELGFSQVSPRAMSIFQGTDGVISRLQYLIDVYIAGGEVRWLRQAELLMLFIQLESDGTVWRKENCPWRFLCNNLDQLDFDNEPIIALSNCHIRIMNLSTPANYFHAILSQVSLPFRKPLAIFISADLFSSNTIKSLKKEFIGESSFQSFIPEESSNDKNIKRLILCTGILYYKLASAREKLNLQKTIAIARLEQISPFPCLLVAKELDRFPTAEVIWAQLEPQDRAWYQYVKPRIEKSDQKKRHCKYIGRALSFNKTYDPKMVDNIINKSLTI